MKTDLSLLEEFALVGLAHAGVTGATANRIKQMFKTELGSVKPDFAGSLETLRDRGLVEKMPRGKGQKSSFYRLQPAGWDTLEERLGGMTMTGRTGKQKVARALGLTRAHDIPIAVAATLVTDEALLVWSLAAKLGEPYRAGTTWKTLAGRVAAEALGAASTKPSALWRALFQRVSAQQESSGETPASDSFAEQVRGAAPNASEGWFGPHKLFIHHAWKAWKVASGEDDDLPIFKKRLLTALRAGEIELTRADFTATLDPNDLERSEIRDGSEAFHFVTSERRQDRL